MSNDIRQNPARIGRSILSAPIFLKVLGVGAVVALIFGSVTLYSTHRGTEAFRQHATKLQLSTTTQQLARSIEHYLMTGDRPAIQRLLATTLEGNGAVLRVALHDFDGNLVAQAVAPDAGVDLAMAGVDADENGMVTNEGTLYVWREQLGDGQLGTIRVTATDQMFVAQTNALNRNVLVGLLVSVALGITMAFLLTHYLSNPIRQLKMTAERIGAGELNARAKLFYDDEIGALANSVNQMAESLEENRREIEEKEEARTALMDRIVTVAEDERKFVARELHDQLGQSLSTTLLKLKQLANECSARKSTCREIEADIRGHIDEVRRIAWNLRPPILDDHGLNSALRRLSEQVAGQLDIEIKYQSIWSVDNKRLSSTVETSLYRITQEALTNIIRHAKATEVDIVLVQQEDEITLVIEDDGCGFDMSSHLKNRKQSLGLVGMRERAAFVGGDVEIESRIGNGTEIVVRIPLKESFNVNTRVYR